MPLEAKLLFRPDVLRERLKYFNLPAATRALQPDLAKWGDFIRSRRIDAQNEKEILPDFLTLFFDRLLGYLGPAENAERYTRSREKHVQVDGKFADAAFGVFTPQESKFVIAPEGKSSVDPLERPFAGRKKSAIEQGYGYAINLPCDWIVITSMRETRLDSTVLRTLRNR